MPSEQVRQSEFYDPDCEQLPKFGRKKLRWGVGANRYRNPDEDLPGIDIRDNCVTVASRMEATNFVG